MMIHVNREEWFVNNTILVKLANLVTTTKITNVV